MKEERSEVINATRDIVIECSHEQHPTKIASDWSNETNNDAGYMTSSSNSLHIDVADDETWRLSLPPKLSNLSVQETLGIFREARAEMEKLPAEERRKWLVDQLTGYYGAAMPTSLIELTASHYVNGDSGISVDVKPDWLDIDKFRRGQKFALNNISGIFYADLLSLLTVFSFEDGIKPLVFTDASSTPYTAFKRYLSTGLRVRSWYTSDPWTAGTPAYNDIRTVRRMHAMVRKKIHEMPIDEYAEKTSIKNAWCPVLNRTRRDFESTCPAPKPGQCPYMADISFQLKELKLSQGEMAATQFAFVGFFILNPKFFGAHDATDEDLEAYCHVWRGLGYLLGIDDESNFCRGTLEDVRTRSRDFLEYWVKPNLRFVKPEWEHMMRCVVEGMQYYFTGSTYEACLLDLAEIMNLHLPRTYTSLSYGLWIKYKVTRFYFNQGAKLSVLKALMNRRLHTALEKARNFDERKHQELEKRSAITIDSYIAQTKSNEITSEISSYRELEYV